MALLKNVPAKRVSAQSVSVRYSALVKRVERLLEEVPSSDEVDETVRGLVEHAAAALQEELGFTGGRLYKRFAQEFQLLLTFGRATPLADPPVLPAAYPPVDRCCAEGMVYFHRDDPRLDRELEDALGVEEFAAIEVGDEAYLIAFDLVPGLDREEVLISLGILRQIINQRIRQERTEDVFREARKIQASILPRRVPSYGSYDLAGRNDSLDEVGGDFYDYIPISEKILGLTIADVTGHGLPAALQVRDIYMGLRMGLGREYKIVHTMERLSSIIHRSTITSRFVSLFYGELELNGNFLYVNAGHPPPFHLSAAGDVTSLEQGGVVMGPLPAATYERGYCLIRPGDLLVLYTDGIVEAHCDSDQEEIEEYGRDRLIEIVRSLRDRPAAEIVAGIFEDVGTFCDGCPPNDDRTVVVLRYPEED